MPKIVSTCLRCLIQKLHGPEGSWRAGDTYLECSCHSGADWIRGWVAIFPSGQGLTGPGGQGGDFPQANLMPPEKAAAAAALLYLE